MQNSLLSLGRIIAICWHYGLQKQKVEMAYRIDFFVHVFVGLLYNVIQLFFLWALLRNIPDIRGWSFEEVVLIYGFGQLSFGYFAITCFDLSIRFADYYIIEGNLDRPLVRPLNPLLQLVMESLTFRDISVVIKGTAIIWWALAHLSTPVQMTIGSFLAVQGLGLIGAGVYCGVFLGMASLSFWVKDRVGLTSPLFSISEASRYPLTIYHPGVQLFFSVMVPFGYCAFYPAAYFIDPANWGSRLLYAPIAAALSLAVGITIFHRGLRVYESTGS